MAYKNTTFTLSVVLILFLLLSVSTSAEVPPIINYQGNLMDSGGNPVGDGSYSVTFSIYNSAISAVPIWTETQNVNIQNGLFSVVLGMTNPFTDDVFGVATKFLGIKVGSAPELSPRTLVVTVPYAFRTSTVDGATGGAVIGELDLTNTLNTASSDTVFGQHNVSTNTGFGKAVGGKFSAYCAEESSTGIGVFGEAFVDGVDGYPKGVYGKAYNGLNGPAAGGYFNVSGDQNGDCYGIDIHSTNLSSAYGIKSYVHSTDGTASGSWNLISGTNSVYGAYNSAHSDGGDAYGIYAATAGSSPGSEYGGYFKTSLLSDVPKYGTYVEGYSAANNSVYGNYANMSSDNTGSIFGSYHYLSLSTGSTGSGYGSYNYVKRDADAGDGYLYGVRNYIRNYNTTNASGIYAIYNYAYSASSTGSVYGIYSDVTGGATQYAGYFMDDVYVGGTLSKAGGSFKIDHPLDPANKYLQHSFVESPDMKNVYDGVVTLDEKGEAIVVMPDYFEALNQDFRYQLTSIGTPGPNLYIAEKISDNHFRIAGGEPNSEVSWQVTGVRHDKWANQNRIKVEVDKPDSEKNLYLHPELYGFDKTRSVNYKDEPERQMDNQDKNDM